MTQARAPYPARMAVSAHAVASELRRRRPGLPAVKLHKLLYYCQGHHLATFGVPLFDESLSAWDMGPVVGRLWYDERVGRPVEDRTPMDEAGLNTVGYVLSRYGALTGTDLRHLTHSETPWRLADSHRTPGSSARIETAWMEDYFRAVAGSGDDDEPVLDAAVVADWLKDAERTRDAAAPPDTPEQLTVRAAELRARATNGG